jgi:hypothetical protein
MRPGLGFLLLALPALAQLHSSALRAKFGPPLNRETFQVPQGFDLIVDYGKNHEVRKLEVPGEPSSEMQWFFLSLVPDSARGKELTRTHWIVGGSSVSGVIYEHVVVKETDAAGRSKTVSVEFRRDGCTL